MKKQQCKTLFTNGLLCLATEEWRQNYSLLAHPVHMWAPGRQAGAWGGGSEMRSLSGTGRCCVSDWSTGILFYALSFRAHYVQSRGCEKSLNATWVARRQKLERKILFMNAWETFIAAKVLMAPSRVITHPKKLGSKPIARLPFLIMIF